MLSRLETKIVLISLLLLLPITGGLTAYTVLQVQESKQFTNRNNGYVEPKLLGSEILWAQDSLVMVNCAESTGSGFSFNFDASDVERGFKFKSEGSEDSSYIITNSHVVKSCTGSNLRVIVADKSSHFARVINVDLENDLALLTTAVEIPPLFAAYQIPFEGFWVMALGSPHGLAGSVTFGNVINRDSKQIFTTASLSPGNSGGPLIDNEGYVFGVNTGAKPVGQNFNISVGVNMFCEKLIICPDGRFWEEE
jgi:S1-C subfamily serine protease